MNDATSPPSAEVALSPAEVAILQGDPLEGCPWLAEEFVLWLWFASERDFSTFTLGEGDTVDLWIDDRLVFKSVDENSVSSAFRGGAPSTLPEARLSVLSGKRIAEARMGLRKGESEWRFVLKVTGGGLLLTGLKLPTVVKDGVEEMIYERMFLLDTLVDAIEKLFFRFFRIRTARRWAEDEAPQLKAWLLGSAEDDQSTDVI